MESSSPRVRLAPAGGLLTATMFSRGREVVQLNLMCQVTLGPGDKLHRMIYSPLG